MKTSIFLVALLCLAIFSYKEAMAIELDTVWVSDINGQVLFQHPGTKNILVATNGGITELNSQDGKFVRSFPFDVTNSDLSPDGTKILNSGNNTYTYSFIDGKAIETIEFGIYSKFLTNDIVICRDRITSNIIKYNLNTKEKVEFDPPHPVTALASSPDSKYIAYATYEENNTTDSKAHLFLLDAVTFQGVGELGSWDSEGQQIQDITFSPNSKYVTYSLFLTGKNQVNIYDLESQSIFKSLDLENFPYPTVGFYFLGDDYYVQYGIRNSKKVYELGIYKMISHEKLYNTNDYQSFFFSPIFNPKNNHLFYNNLGYNVFCANLNNIISGVAPVVPINTKYSNKTLFINSNDKLLKQISIMTIEGREVFKISFEGLVNISNPIEIPLALSNGCYIINFVSDKETYTEKIIIVE
jgi:hypothetical protein